MYCRICSLLCENESVSSQQASLPHSLHSLSHFFSLLCCYNNSCFCWNKSVTSALYSFKHTAAVSEVDVGTLSSAVRALEPEALLKRFSWMISVRTRWTLSTRSQLNLWARSSRSACRIKRRTEIKNKIICSDTSKKIRIWWKMSFFLVTYFNKWNFHIF